MPKTTDAIKMIDAELAKDPALRKRVRIAEINAVASMELYRLRTEAGLSQEQLAKLLKVSPAVIDDLEAGDMEENGAGILLAAASALKAEIDERVAEFLNVHAVA